VKRTDLKQKLALGPCFGTFLKLPRPEIVDILAFAGFDFVICDMEHAQIAEAEAREVIRACVAADLPVIVRLPDPTQGLVNRLLEAGATGIQMPRLRSGQEARQLHSIMHFPPVGTRSTGTSNNLAGYGTVPIPQYLEQENARVLTIGQVENKELEQPFDRIFDGVDIAFIGPTDLSVDFGVPGNSKDPVVIF
jgi:2-keto-3-deoxy-L-rhamnonate aldolase RhmA